MIGKKLITLENVGCWYSYRSGLLNRGQHQALKDISFTIHEGETIGLIGQNGAGKSTLLRIIADIILPDSGRVIRHSPVSTSLLTLNLGISPELSGRDNAVLSALLFGYSMPKIKSKLEDIKGFSELGQWFEKPIKSYSSGMLARLGFAVAIEMSPDILLVDEVLGVGDMEFRKKSTKAMKSKMLSGQTVIFVSHQDSALRELCSSAVWIDEGRSVQLGPPEEVLQQYHTAMKKRRNT
ncbi:MAG: ABC transporter ATP-binding protein [Desulfovibrio sp.]|jgi:lipopolysaccharide transport system ATP-binding protein